MLGLAHSSLSLLRLLSAALNIKACIGFSWMPCSTTKTTKVSEHTVSFDHYCDYVLCLLFVCLVGCCLCIWAHRKVAIELSELPNLNKIVQSIN